MDHSTENIAGISRVAYTSRIRERQRFDLTIRPEENEEDDISRLAALVGQTWDIYAVSALFDFHQDDVHLKLYSKALREELASTLSREDVTYDTDFSIMNDITLRSDHENHLTIKIEVTAKTDDQEKDAERTVYKGILLSWKATPVELNIQNSVKLPLLLCRGTRNCMNAVHAIIGRMFDCLVTALPVEEQDLRWLVPIIIMPANEQSIPSGLVQMIYTVPGLPVTDTITVKFQTSELRKILTAIVTNQNDDSTAYTVLDREHAEMFHEVLHTQMLAIGSLQLGLCTLHKIILPGVTIMENRMKIIDAEVMNRVLLYLNEKAFDTFHTLHIDI